MNRNDCHFAESASVAIKKLESLQRNLTGGEQEDEKRRQESLSG